MDRFRGHVPLASFLQRKNALEGEIPNEKTCEPKNSGESVGWTFEGRLETCGMSHLSINRSMKLEIATENVNDTYVLFTASCSIR